MKIIKSLFLNSIVQKKLIIFVMSWKPKKMYYPLIYKTIIINILIILFNSNSHAVYKKLFDPVIPDQIYIELNKKNLGIYANHIYQIQDDKNLNIHPRNKKYFSGNISFKKSVISLYF